ncbi:MAG: reductase-subunit oxygenase, partial [Subtercola sp.]|nr:reductase-subunit oxygenase [Subtercola sp.]
DSALFVSARTQEADGIISIELRDPHGADLPEWQPGAHIDVELGPEKIVRQYSLCGDPRDRSVLKVAILREAEGRGGSVLAHRVEEGQTVRLRGIRNHFELTGAPSFVFIAGGIGVTPLLPMIEEVERLGLPWELHYVGRSRRSMAFADTLEARFGSTVTVYPKDEGMGLELLTVLTGRDADTGIYACGPARLLDAFEAAGEAAGLVPHVERFTASVDAVFDSVDDTAFDVYLEQSGVTITVEPGQSILDVAEAAGADVFGSCLEGICGTCETRVLAGVPVHRDSVLNGQQTGTMMICVSRSAGALLTLDA